MVRPDTAAIVAVVADVQAIRDGSVFLLPRIAVRPDWLSRDVGLPIAGVPSASLPFPATRKGETPDTLHRLNPVPEAHEFLVSVHNLMRCKATAVAYRLWVVA